MKIILFQKNKENIKINLDIYKLEVCQITLQYQQSYSLHNKQTKGSQVLEPWNFLKEKGMNACYAKAITRLPQKGDNSSLCFGKEAVQQDVKKRGLFPKKNSGHTKTMTTWEGMVD